MYAGAQWCDGVEEPMKTIAICIVVLLLGSCGGKMRLREESSENSPLTLPAQSQTVKGTAVKPVTPEQLPLSPPHWVTPIPPEQWRGMVFVALPKQEPVSRFGYELFSCKPAACAGAPIDTAWELNNHRIRCDRLVLDSLKVESVEKAGPEWLVTLRSLSTQRHVYATTHKHAVSEIAWADDLAAARKRWMGRSVFSRRGIISLTGEGGRGPITGARVKIQDSLVVTDVIWGTVPLPVKPIWLMVKSKSGLFGVIAVRFSWTNTMNDLVTQQLPWEEDIFEQNPVSLFGWDEYIWEVINNHRVITGMNPEQVRISWGEPQVVSEDSAEDGSSLLIWTYPSNTLTFINNTLGSITGR